MSPATSAIIPLFNRLLKVTLHRTGLPFPTHTEADGKIMTRQLPLHSSLLYLSDMLWQAKSWELIPV